MQIFDFHLHPGYDFHNPAIPGQVFTDNLKRKGIVGCSGSWLSKACRNLPADQYGKLIADYNRNAWEFHESAPDFYIPGIHIHPDFPELSINEIETHNAKGGNLVGELVPYMMGWNLTHPNLDPLFTRIRDLDMVVCIHLPRDLAPVIRIMDTVPGLKLVISHFCDNVLYDDLINLLMRYDSLYADISAHRKDHPDIIADAVNKIGSKKILYGSDYPGYDPDGFIKLVTDAKISTREKEDILYQNATNLLNFRKGGKQL